MCDGGGFRFRWASATLEATRSTVCIPFARGGIFSLFYSPRFVVPPVRCILLTSFGLVDFVTLILFAVALINLALAGVVFGHRPAQAVNRVFAITGASVALWTLTNALFRVSTSVPAATLWAQISYAAALMTAASFLQFSRLYPDFKANLRKANPKHQGQKQAEAVSLIMLWMGAALLSALSFVARRSDSRG